MFSLSQLFGKDDKFYHLLEASATQACDSVNALVALLKKPAPQRSPDDFARIHRRDKRIHVEISAALCKTMVTPLEREDIEALSDALYKIPKTVEKFGEQLLLCQQHLPEGTFQKQSQLMEQTIATVSQMVQALRHNPKLETMKERNDRLQFLEGEADKLMLELLRDLYGGNYETLQVIMLRSLYELLEKVIDRCRDAGNVIMHITLKNS